MTRRLKITFVLPGPAGFPSGGYKVVYEYANHLSRKGHEVVVVHASRGCSPGMGALDHLKCGVRYLQVVAYAGYRPDSWFQVDPNVSLLFVPNLFERWVPIGDVVIATAWRTAEWVSRYSPARGRKFYLIQHLETWEGHENRVYATWKAPLQKIVISKWLLDIAKSMGEEAVYIPNGLNPDEFEMDVSSEKRDPKRIMMLYHKVDWKGSSDGLEALSIVRLIEPEIKVTLFGVDPRPVFLAKWIDYYQKPRQDCLRALYNKAAIFVAPSWAEGWSLPSCEAMLCGAALVATDIGGHREFAFHEKTALLSAAKDPQGLADNLVRLIRDSTLRLRLAEEGRKLVQQLTWERASDRLQSILHERVANSPELGPPGL